METMLPDPFEKNPDIHFPDPLVSDWAKPLVQEPIGVPATEQGENLQFMAETVGCDWGARVVPSGTLGQEAVGVSATVQDENQMFLAESMICDSGSRLVPSGFRNPCCTEDIVYFINAGAEASRQSDSSISFMPDKFFQGGNAFQTEEFIAEGGDYPFIYQSARLGNFTYHVPNLPRGEYFVDLHFVEIINVNGPKGMRVFNVFLQDEKVLSDFDIFSVVGANKPLQLVDSRVSIKDDGVLAIKFEGIIGSPVVSGICIRRAPEVSASQAKGEHLICTNCAAEVEFPLAQKKAMRMQSTAKYEKKIQELSELLQRKTDECYQSWMSVSAANQHLEKVRMELDNKTFQTYSLDQNLEKQALKLTEISSRYEHDKQVWHGAISNLEQKVKIMKQEHSQLSREAHECVDSIPDLSKMVFAVQSLVEQCEDLKFKYNEEQAKRRKLFNEVQEAKGNIRVFCRCRPLNKAEVSAGCSMVVDFDAAKDGELGVINGGSTKKTFKFDRVYTPKDDQVDVYADASPMVISVLDGYNVCIFAYGQTGTGKTFTMEGNEENRGVNYRTLEELFKISKERGDTFTYDISVSVLEVYNEQIRDLLSTSSSSSSKKLEIKQASEGFHHIPGIVEARVKNINEVWSVLQAGSSARAVGSNNVNEHSSRSHCMLCIMVRAKNLITGECTKSKLWLVDLAGSERLAKTDVQGDRLKEAQNINRSLSALGDVISALANKSTHIPYRNSKLTHLLQDSLGGDSKTLMFVQISPSDKDVSETLSSLNFATRVRGIELGPARKQVDTSELQKLKMMLDKAKHESRSKDESLKKLEESLRSIESKGREKEQVSKSQQDEIKELKAQLELKASLHCQSEKQISHISDRLKGSEETCATLQQKVADLEKKLREQGQFEYENYKNKVKDVENKLKEQLQESESRSIILQLKVEELEKKLKEQEKNSESALLHERIKELEEKVKGKEQQLAVAANYTLVPGSAKPLRSINTPHEPPMNVTSSSSEEENHILRNSNSLNFQSSSHGGLPKQQKELVVQEVRRKRLSTNSEPENNNTVLLPTTLSKRKEHEPLVVHEVRRKRLSRNEGENNGGGGARGRKSDPPPKQFVGTVKPTKTSLTAAAAQRPVVRSNMSRDPVQGVKDRDSKKRIWSR